MANGTEMAVSVERVNREFAERIGDPYGLDGLALVVDSCRPDPEVYLDGALVHYGLAPDAGAMYDDVLVWLVCLDPRYVGFFYAAGNEYAPRFDRVEVTADMPVQLQDGNFTGALTGGLDSAARAIAGQSLGRQDAAAPMGAQAEAAASLAPAVTAAVREVDARDSDGRPAAGTEAAGAPGPGRALALAALGAAGLGGWWVYRRRRAGGPPADAAGGSKPPAQRELEQMVAELDKRLIPNSPELSRMVIAYDSLGDEAVLDLNRRHMAMIERLAELKRTVEALTSGVVPAALADDPEELAERYRGPTAEARELSEYVNHVAEEADHVEMLLERAAILVVEAEDALEESRTRYERAAHGFRLPAADEALGYPRQLVAAAEVALTAGDRITAGRTAEEARSLAGRIADVPEEMERVSRAIDDASRLFPRFDDFAEVSWADVRGNGSEAQESLATAQDMMRRLSAADSVEFGADQTAGYVVSLDRVFDELGRASELVATITQRLQRLQEAKLGSRDAIATIRSEIDEGRTWLMQPQVDRDVDDAPVRQLDQAERALGEVEIQMASPKPDWLAIMRAVQDVDRAVDAAIAGAREQRQRIEALRRQLELAKSAAEAAVERAETFLASHRRDIDAASAAVVDAESALRRAHEGARTAERLQDTEYAEALGSAVLDYNRVTDMAQSAYEAMEADFQRADSAREAYVPRPTWMGPTVPIPVNRRSVPFPIDIGGWGGGMVPHPSRHSRWGGSSGGTSGGGGGGRSGPSGSRPSSSRRGGGSGW